MTPRLSVCLLTAEPAARVQAILRPLRAVADEIVVVADARVDEATVDGYAAVADRVLRIEFHLLERHLGWLHAQCTGDWILRLDGDEAPSAALVARLPELIGSRSADHYRIARAWVHPDAGSILDERPWSTDFVGRLVRATGALRFEGRVHHDAVASGPAAYVLEPIYHLALLLSDTGQRRARAIRYEVAEPWMLTGGERYNDAFQLLEQRGPLTVRAVPDEDRDLVARVLRPPPAAAAAHVRVDVTPAATVDAHWEGRPVGPDAHRARIEAYGGVPSFTAGARERLYVHVTNDGDTSWPWGLDQRPPIWLSYHWLNPELAGVHDGLRTPLPTTVEPGATVLAPVDVLAPGEPGDWTLEIDLVHEHVAWFECGERLEITVGERPERRRLVASRAPRARRIQRVRIPPLLHRIWLGDAPLPQVFDDYGRTFSEHHPDWDMRLWTDADLDELEIGPRERDRARTASELSNLIRYEILSRHGGVYADTDVECRRSFEPLLRGIDAFAALEQPDRVGTAVLGSVPGHQAFVRAAREARETLGLGDHSPLANGPYFLSLIIEQEGGVHIFEPDVFYPYLWHEPERAGEPFPEAYAVHHWATSWR